MDLKEELASLLWAGVPLVNLVTYEEDRIARLLGEIDNFVGMGLMSDSLLPFFWRATALAPSDYEAAKRMLPDAGVLLALDVDGVAPRGGRLRVEASRACTREPGE